MADSFSSNLGNYDPDGQYPSAASPLDIDELLKARAVSGPAPASWAAWPGQQGTENREQGTATDTRNLKPVTSPSAMAGAGSVPSTDYSGLAMGQLQQGESNLTAAEQAAAEPEPTNPDLDALNTKIAGESVPTQLRANRAPGETGPGTGEMLAQYKPSGWDRFGRGVRGAAVGLLTGGIPGAALGAIEPQDVKGGTAYGAPNKAYQQTEAERTATLANDEAQLPGMSEQLKQAIEARRQRIADNEKLGADRGTMGRDVTAVETAANETPEAKAKAEDLKNATDFADRQQRWKTVGNLVPPSQRDAQQAHYLLTGQLPEPQQPRQASPEEALVGQGMAKFRQQFNREPTVSEWAGIVQAARGNAGGGGGGMGPAPAPVGSDGKPLQGEDYLKTVDPGIAAQVRAIGEGREALPAGSSRSPQAQQIRTAVNVAYPNYSEAAFPTYKSTMERFTSGPIGTAINSFNTSLNHIARMEQNIPSGSSISLVNRAENALAPSGSGRGITLGKWDTDANAVSNEVEKAYKGGAVTEGEHNQMLKLLDRNAAPERMRSNLAELRQLLTGKLESYRQQWNSAMPAGTSVPGMATIGVRPGVSNSGNGQGGSQQPFDWGKEALPVGGPK